MNRHQRRRNASINRGRKTYIDRIHAAFSRGEQRPRRRLGAIVAMARAPARDQPGPLEMMPGLKPTPFGAGRGIHEHRPTR